MTDIPLNSLQQEAVHYKGGHLLMVAGPGTGKTHTLTCRIAHQTQHLESHERILAITFTNKAAEQLKNRLMAQGVALNKIFIGTFHAFGLYLLRNYLEHTALPRDFKIALEDDLKSFDTEILDRISYLKSTQLIIDPDDAYKTYSRHLHDKGLIDFDDILREALMLLEIDEVARQVQDEYRYIYVDEYQDVNVIQHALLKALLGTRNEISAIGDPHQGIYGFRGANAALFTRFADDFKGARVIYLKENYRSAPNILTASTQVIEHASDHPYALQLFAHHEREGKLFIHEAATDRMEADYVAVQIEKLIGGRDMRNAQAAQWSLGDIAVLYRLNAQGAIIAQALDHLGIPYHMNKKRPRAVNYSDEDALCQREESAAYQVEKVSLLSLHASKGLEFSVVFMVGCEEHLLPLDMASMTSDVNEERRLFYVGMTRARDVLYLTYARRRQIFGQGLNQNPSIFISDIQEQLKSYTLNRARRQKPLPVDDGQMQLF